MDIQNAFKAAVAHAGDNRGKPGILGKVDGTLLWGDRRDMVWVQVGEGDSRQEVVAYCYTVSPQRGLPVRIDNVNGTLTVIGTDQRRAAEFSNGRPGFALPAHAWLHSRNGSDPVYIEGLQFLPFLVVPVTGAMTVSVRGGAYRWRGVHTIFETSTSGSLASYVPASAAVGHFVIICLDRDTNTIVIVDGDDVTAGGGDALFPAAATVTAAQIMAIDIDSAYLPLAVVLLYYGQTSIGVADIMTDVRLWGMESDDNGAIWYEHAAEPATPVTGKWHLYFKSDGLYTLDDTGAEVGPLGVTATPPPDTCFGSIYTEAETTAQNINTGTSYTFLTNYEGNGPSQNCTPNGASDDITITDAGFYEVNLTISFKDDTGGVVWDFAPFLGGTQIGIIHIKAKTGAANEILHASMTGVVEVASVPVDIDTRARHDNGGTIALTVEYANFSIKRIGT